MVHPSSRAAARLLGAAFVVLAGCPTSAPANGVARVASNAWLANGGVTDVAAQGNTLFLAGHFDRIAPRSGPLVVVDRLNGLPDLSLPRLAGGSVADIAPDGAGGYVVAGSFASVGGLTRPGLARLTADLALDTSFAPLAIVQASFVVVSADRVFAVVTRRLPDGTTTPPTLAAFALSSGQALSWAPAISLQEVRGLDAGPNGSLLVRDFASGGRLLRLDGNTGAQVWAGAYHETLAIEGTSAYTFDFGGVVHIDLATGVRSNVVSADFCTGRDPSPVCQTPYALAVATGRLYMTGPFRAIGGVDRARGIGAVDLTSGSVLPWYPTWPDATYLSRASGSTALESSSRTPGP